MGLASLVGLVVPATTEAAIPYDAQLTPGALRGIAYAPGDPWLYGYWEYLPTDFDEADPPRPLLVFLPGIGEYDDVSSCPGGTDVCTANGCDGDGLCRNLAWGPQQLIRTGGWDDVLRPFIVVSPQHPVPPGDTTEWDIDRLDDFVQFIVDEYPVDQRRMYLIGMSQGGRATLQHTQAHARRFTAVAPTPGGSVDPDASCWFQDTALWVFHGEDDADGNLGPGVFAPCGMVGVAYQYENPGLYVDHPQCVAIDGQPRPPARLTMFYDVAHFSWVQTVDPINLGFPASEWASDQGCGLAAPYRQYEAALDSDGVYSWFLSLDRPRVVAPADLTVDAPEVSLAATVTDDDVVTIEWTQTAGPSATLIDATSATLDVADLVPSEQYTFQVYVLDGDEQWDLDEVVVTTEDVFPAGGSSSGTSSGTGDGGESTSGSGTGSTGGSGASADAADDTTGVPGGSSGAAATSAGSGSTDDGTSSPGSDDGGGSGCACRTERRASGAWLGWAVMVMVLGLPRRKRAERGPRRQPGARLTAPCPSTMLG